MNSAGSREVLSNSNIVGQRKRNGDCLKGKGEIKRLNEFAADLVRLNVSVIVTSGTPPTIAAKRATPVIPIVFAVSGDPVGSGLVASLARPSGNVTGLSIQSVDAVSKRVELLRDVVPNLRRLAVLAEQSNPVNRREVEEVQAVVVEVVLLDVRRADDIASAFATLDGRVEALYFTSNPLFQQAYNQRSGTESAIARHKPFPRRSGRRRSPVMICFGAPLSWSTR
jgi:ABC-type uncharacterized transport system substrate-binding protein